MSLLQYLKLSMNRGAIGAQRLTTEVRIAIITNFTDDLLEKIMTGMCIAEGIAPSIFTVPFKQYPFELKDRNSPLHTFNPEITFVFFDINPYLISEFTADRNHLEDVVNDLRNFSEAGSGNIIIHTFASPATVQHGRVLKDAHISSIVRTWNDKVHELASTSPHVHVIETDRLVAAIGEKQARDLRSLFAFSQPFSHDFLLSVACEWMAYVRLIKGKVRKCLVLDLDNVLWGGIVGEVGPLGIELGTEYPGNAYREFQRIVLDYYNHGIILAVNSRNNPADVDEVFEKNPHMLLKKSHFAAFAVNWKTKPENLRAIAEELNIGLDSLVFLDDDPVNRDMTRQQLPEVFVPEFSLPPEEYGRVLLDLDAFHTLKMTDEDKERGKMYAAERERKVAASTLADPEKYLETLGIVMNVSKNNPDNLPRLAQLTQKTNQFNLTTYRSTEQELRAWMDSGAFLYAADVHDKFGPYGTTVMAAVRPTKKGEADLTIFLMSCRVMGRRIERVFMREIMKDLDRHGVKKLHATFIPTKKNAPSADFLAAQGGIETGRSDSGHVSYEFNVHERATHSPAEIFPMQVNFSA